MPRILLDHIAIALPRIADASAVLMAALGAPPPVRILGLRLRAKERAVTQ